MARFNLSFLAVFLVLAAFAMSLPTKRDGQTPSADLGLDKTLDELKSATRIMNGLDQKDTNDQMNDIEHHPTVNKDSDNGKKETEEKKVETPEATKTEKKLTSGTFVTAAPTTHHATSVPNGLGKLPIVGGLLGGTKGL
ncbi:hypothetical protein N7520_010671 [Penicillium odoratum]|uniref:uncharacterized protein n=1 Tax=Penicillium odoratum TaxID=1167516 RepID=UPI00254856A4|nr:uncharacterized protein N7520_010671 [Penicillium odoratum]KAJ5745489.1 hypothetical protein N7520_010671 [Penicillium odoratum]